MVGGPQSGEALLALPEPGWSVSSRPWVRAHPELERAWGVPRPPDPGSQAMVPRPLDPQAESPLP